MKAQHYTTEPIAAFEWIKKHQCPNMVQALSVESLVNAQLNVQRLIEKNHGRLSYIWSIGQSNMILAAMDRQIKNFFGEVVAPMTPTIHVIFSDEAVSRYRLSYDKTVEFNTDLNNLPTKGIPFPLDERIWLLPYLFRLQYVHLINRSKTKVGIVFDVSEHCKRALAMNLIHKNTR